MVAISGALVQLLIRVDPQEALMIELVDWAIISVFILEYATKFYLAQSEKRYVTFAWSMLNLLIILLAFAGTLTASLLLNSAPILRVIRATRLSTESGRSSVELQRD